MTISIPFRPKLLEALKGYSTRQLRRDFGAGVNVMTLAFPLSMAFAIAAGVKPEQGLWTAIIGGSLIAAFGGSRVQIGGPTGAFVIITYSIDRLGEENVCPDITAALARARQILGLPPVAGMPEAHEALHLERQTVDSARKELAEVLERAQTILKTLDRAPGSNDSNGKT